MVYYHIVEGDKGWSLQYVGSRCPVLAINMAMVRMGVTTPWVNYVLWVQLSRIKTVLLMQLGEGNMGLRSNSRQITSMNCVNVQDLCMLSTT